MSRFLVGYSTLVFALGVVLLQPSPLSSANLTAVKDTLQSSRLSVNARVDATGTTTGSSNVKLKTVASAPANTISTANLRAQDSIIIGTGTYTIVDIVDSDEFTVTPVLASGDTDDNDPIYLKMKPRHVVTLTTASAVTNGTFRILLPADATTPNDGNPDDQGYDFNTTVSVTASNVTGYTFASGTSTVAGGTNCLSPANYHCFDISYTGAGAVGATIVINIGNTNGTNTPIAPATGTAHTEGTADSYPVIVRNFANGADLDADEPIDATTVRVAHIEAVRVTATVDPTISFSIAGIASGNTRCGVSTSVTTTATSVPFGGMTLNSFKTLAQDLTVSTNASGGYVVTASENDELGLGGSTTPFIPDTTCDSGTCTISSQQDWNTATNTGFGYSIENVDAASVPFEYDSIGSFDAKPFANIVDGDTPQTIFSSTTVANAENAYVCYRLSVGATQAAGDYENQITYTATGTF